MFQIFRQSGTMAAYVVLATEKRRFQFANPDLPPELYLYCTFLAAGVDIGKKHITKEDISIYTGKGWYYVEAF